MIPDLIGFLTRGLKRPVSKLGWTVPLELAANFIPVREWEQDYARSFDPEGRNAQTVQDIADWARALGAGQWASSEKLVPSSPLDDLIAASAASPSNLAPDYYPSLPGLMPNIAFDDIRGAHNRQRQENYDTAERSRNFDIANQNWSVLQNTVRNRVDEINRAARNFRAERAAKGLKTTVDDIANFRKQFRRQYGTNTFRSEIAGNPDKFPGPANKNQIDAYKIR